MFVIVTVRLRKWSEAEKIMKKKFMKRDQTIYDWTMDFFLQDKMDKTTRACVDLQFEGREEILQLLTTHHIQDRK